MGTITLTVSRKEVYEEVDKTTDYTGTKLMDGDKGARDRIVATQTDLKELSRFWEEACVAANERLKEMYESGSLPTAEDYSATLNVSIAFDKSLVPSVAATLKSYFIKMITGKWYVFANKGEAGDYLSEAASLMEDVRRKLYSRKMIRSPRKKTLTSTLKYPWDLKEAEVLTGPTKETQNENNNP